MKCANILLGLSEEGGAELPIKMNYELLLLLKIKASSGKILQINTNEFFEKHCVQGLRSG